MEVKCYTDDRNNKDYILKQDEKILKIMFGGTLDLYIQLINPALKEELGYDTFEITKDNYYIYSYIYVQSFNQLFLLSNYTQHHIIFQVFYLYIRLQLLLMPQGS